MQKEKLKKYIFIIDEINRGEISKIFGELFFSIDPGYRGSAGAVATQYENLHENRSDKFYVPENIYIIGTMNDIDRSVDSFDFAMRRRFRFIEIKADTRVEMLDLLEKNVKLTAMEKMAALNKAIAETEGLNENYQIGASYFLKLQHIGFVLKFMGAIPSIMSLSKSYAGIFIIVSLAVLGSPLLRVYETETKSPA